MSAGDHGSYILIAMMWGGDEDFLDRRIWSQEFRTRQAAEAAMTELKRWDKDIQVSIFDDFEED